MVNARDLWEGLIYFTLRCQINGGSKKTGDGKFLKILINGGWEFSEKFNKAGIIRNDRTHVLWRTIFGGKFCFCFGL